MKLFGIKNNYVTCRTEITLFGLKLKLYNKNLIKHPDYSAPLKKVQEKYINKQKIRVGFYVSENAKWNGEELYKLFEQSEEFEPIVLASILSYTHKGDSSRNSVQENYEFFKNCGKNVVKAYDDEKKEFIPLENFDLDIIFYQQPWGIPDIHNIETTKKFSLSCYFEYGLNVLNIFTNIHFKEKLFMYFIPNKEEKENLVTIKYKNMSNLQIVGYPKLDVYNNLNIEKLNKKTIIYAPHFSYKKNSLLKIGTFDKTGEKILEFAKQNSQYNWIFKPHPTLKTELINDKNYGLNFANTYYNDWAKIGKVYDKGNYFGQFAISDLLITDCDSFLLEYMPTLNPIIRLERKDSAMLSPLGKRIIDGIYRVDNFEKSKFICNKILQNNYDELKEKRIEITNTILRRTKNASENIFNKLEKLFIDDEVINEK